MFFQFWSERHTDKPKPSTRLSRLAFFDKSDDINNMKLRPRSAFTGLCLAIALTPPLCVLVRNLGTVQETAPSRGVPVSAPKPKPAGLSDALAQLEQPDAVECGRVNVWTKQRAFADACAVTALRAKKPFRLRYEIEGRRESTSVTIIGNRQGHVYFLSKTQGCCDDPAIEDDYLCKHPTVAKVGGKLRIACKDHRNLTP